MAVAKKWSEKGNQVQVCVSLPPEYVARVKQLTAATRVPMAAYFREALEDLFTKPEHAKVLRKAK
jgi:predicted DNA-binding protein